MVARGWAQLFVGKLLAMQGDEDAARELVRAGVESSREAGQLVEAAGSGQTLAFVELHAGAPETAENGIARQHCRARSPGQSRATAARLL